MKKATVLLIVLIIGLAGMPILSFYVPHAKALYSTDQSIVINADGSTTPLDAPISNAGNSTYTMTDDVNVTNNSNGILIKRSNIAFDGNGHTLTGSGSEGIYVSGVNYVTVENTTVKGFGRALHFDGSYNNIIRGNNFSNCGGSVLVMFWSGNNIIDRNNITNGSEGVEAYWGGSANNTFTRNYIANNRFWAIDLHGGAGSSTFYHNIISGPCINDGPDSTWDNGYPSGGNYWIGYISPDLYSGPGQNITGGDGIGDNPIQVSYRTNIDHYPFMMIDIFSVSQNPSGDNVLPTDVVEVNATVTHYFPLEQVILNCTYTNGSATWTSIINMTNLEDDIWNGIIPPSPKGTNVTFAIIAQDNSGNTINSKSQGYTFEYPVVPEFPSTVILPLLVVTSLLAVIVCRRKRRPELSVGAERVRSN